MSAETSWIQPVRDRLLNRKNNNGGDNGDSETQTTYDDNYVNDGSGYYPDIPPSNSYGPMKPPVSEKMIDALISVDKIKPDEAKDLWIFKTPFARHFQLTNLTGTDVQEIQGRLRDIIMVHRWGARSLAYDLQVELALSILSRKSRGDLRDGIRERPMWGGILNIGKYLFSQDVKPPRDTGSWSSMFTGNRNQRRY